MKLSIILSGLSGLLIILASCSGANNYSLESASQTADESLSRGASAVVGVPGGGGSGSSCMPTVGATFDCTSATVTSTKDLSNIVLLFCDGSRQKFESCSGKSGVFSGTGDNAGKVVKGVWIKSGCNSSGDGPGYGQFVDGAANCTTCNTCPPPPPCDPPIPPVCDPPAPPACDPPAPPVCGTCGGKNKNDGKDRCCDGNAGAGNDWKCGCGKGCKSPKTCKPSKPAKDTTCSKCGGKNKNDGKDRCCDGNAGSGNDWKCGCGKGCKDSKSCKGKK